MGGGWWGRECVGGFACEAASPASCFRLSTCSRSPASACERGAGRHNHGGVFPQNSPLGWRGLPSAPPIAESARGKFMPAREGWGLRGKVRPQGNSVGPFGCCFQGLDQDLWLNPLGLYSETSTSLCIILALSPGCMLFWSSNMHF